MKINIGQSVLELAQGDITLQNTEAIANAANSALAGGGGVDGAIHRAGGPEIMKELKARYKGCPTGSAVITSGGNLKAKYVIHAVGPRYTGKPKDAELLASAYRTSLELCAKHRISFVAFPSISTGVYGYPVDEAAEIAIKTVSEYLKANPEIKLVRFVLFDAATYKAYGNAIKTFGNVANRTDVMWHQQIFEKLKSLSDPKAAEGMARFGINSNKTYGVFMPKLRKLAKDIGKNHDLAEALWVSEIHEARILAGMIDELGKVTEKQMDNWAADFDSWDVCDQVCMNLFDKTPCAFEKAIQWTSSEKEFVKRAGFALMACLAWHDKTSHDSKFIRFFEFIKRGSSDNRNFVKKAVNWALRQIGKRNLCLNKIALKTAKEISKLESKSARWIASDAIRELESKAVQDRLSMREQ